MKTNITTESYKSIPGKLHCLGNNFYKVCLFLILMGFSTFGQEVNITVRFSNPQFDFLTGVYTLDAEFNSDTPDQRLFGMNVRFFYDDSVLEFIEFYDFAGGYGPVSPNPPHISTGGSTSGPAMFSLNGAVEYINGAVQLVQPSAQPVYISSTGWTKLFSVRFEVEDYDLLGFDDFCPSVIWDLEENPSNGGFLTGSSGVVITLVAVPPMQSMPSNQQVVQFNWQYSGSPGLPYGFPVPEHCISLSNQIVANDDYINDFINGCIGSLNAGNVLANDQINGNPINPEQVLISIIDDDGLTGVEITPNGDLAIPAGTPAGTYAVTYSICEAINPINCDFAEVLVAIFTTLISCPDDFNICETQLPVTLGGSFPDGGIYQGDFVDQNSITGMYEFAPPSHGSYTVFYIFTDEDSCEIICDFEINVLNLFLASVSGLDEVFSCSETNFEIEDFLTGDVPEVATFTWNISGGGAFVDGNTGASVTIQWDNIIESVVLTIMAEYGEGQTFASYSAPYEINKISPTLSGQVKYWNMHESYMPSPYLTYPDNDVVIDYFYVTLCRIDPNEVITELETVIVNTHLEGSTEELLSYFSFDLPVDNFGCDGYLVKVWDGGMCYNYGWDPPAVEGTYLKNNFTFNNWNGVNSTDAMLIQHMVVGNAINTLPNMSHLGAPSVSPAYGFFSNEIADPNSSNSLSSMDALLVANRSIGNLSKFPSSKQNQAYSPNFRVSGRIVNQIPAITWPQPFDLGNPNDLMFSHSDECYQDLSAAEDHKYTSQVLPLRAENNYLNIYYSVIGDINASNIPSVTALKQANPEISLINEGEINIRSGDIIDLPFSIGSQVKLGALTLGMSYDNSLIEVIDINYSIKHINHEKGIINFVWFDSEGWLFEKDDTIAVLKVKVLADINGLIPLFKIEPNSEFANETASVLSGYTLKTPYLKTSTDPKDINDISISNYPNPFSTYTNFNYALPESGKVTIAIYSSKGQIVEIIKEEHQQAGAHTLRWDTQNIHPGVYICKIVCEGGINIYSSTRTLIAMP